MTARTVLVAADIPDGRWWLAERNLTERDVTVVSPRSLGRLRGLTVGRVWYTGLGGVLYPGDRKRIAEALRPCLATQRREQ